MIFRKLLGVVDVLNMTGHFLWIASDSWGTKKEPVSSNSLTAEGAITFSPKSYQLTRNLFIIPLDDLKCAIIILISHRIH